MRTALMVLPFITKLCLSLFSLEQFQLLPESVPITIHPVSTPGGSAAIQPSLFYASLPFDVKPVKQLYRL